MAIIGKAAGQGENPNVVRKQNLLAYLKAAGIPFTQGGQYAEYAWDPSFDETKYYVPWNADGTIDMGGIGNDPNNTQQKAYSTYIQQNPGLSQPAATVDQLLAQATGPNGVEIKGALAQMGLQEGQSFTYGGKQYSVAGGRVVPASAPTPQYAAPTIQAPPPSAPLGNPNPTLPTTPTTPTSPTTPTTPTTPQNQVQLPPELEALLQNLEGYLQQLEARGQMINPNIEITPEKLQEFATQAANEIDPYYANLLKTNVEGFMYNLGYSKDQLLQNEKNIQRKYAQGVRTIGENAADQGFAQSGIRNRQEGEYALDTQNQINQARQQLAFNAGGSARQLAGEFGTANVPSFSLGAAPTVGAGESTFGRSLSDSPLYNLSDSVYQGLKGTREFEQEAAKRSRSSELESAFRSSEALKQLRNITL